MVHCKEVVGGPLLGVVVGGPLLELVVGSSL